MPENYIGRALKCSEDIRFITGKGQYVDDIQLPNTHHMVVIQSTHAHARIIRIDKKKAGRMPGVLGVITARDIEGKCKPPPGFPMHCDEFHDVPHPILAKGKVCFVGEPVAAVVASERYSAYDAAELVRVKYEPLPAVVDPLGALSKDAPVLQEHIGTNAALRWSRREPKIDELLRTADLTVQQQFIIPRVAPSPMEPRAALVSYDKASGALTVWAATQSPHFLRAYLAAALSYPENLLRVIGPDVGGVLGAKGTEYAEAVLACVLAMKFNLPIKWAETRHENMLAYQGRGQVADLQMGLRRDGQIVALKARIVTDFGAYYYSATSIIPVHTADIICGVYRIPAVDIESIGVLTNKPPIGPYRGAGQPQGVYYIERMMAIAAARLEMDPVELRRKNLIQPENFPYHSPTGLVYDSGNYEACLNRALEIVGYKALKETRATRRNHDRLLGVGISCYLKSAAGDVRGESGRIKIDPSGLITAITGAMPHGQGMQTTFAQLTADYLGVPIESITVRYGDTSLIPSGSGTFASRSLTSGGSALYRAAEAIKLQARQIVAEVLHVPIAELSYQSGRISVVGSEKSFSFGEIAQMAEKNDTLPPDLKVGLDATEWFELERGVFPFGTQICLVEIDVKTGAVKLLRYVAVEDCGNRVNPLIVEGQTIGAVTQGIGQALWEEMIYDTDGQPLVSSFFNYALPKASDLPWIETDYLETPSPLNPLGAKGVGELGTVGALPAVVNAVVDALSSLGIWHLDPPLTPQKIWTAINNRAAAR